MIPETVFSQFLDPDLYHFSECYQPDSASNSAYITTSELNYRISQNTTGISLLNFNIRSFKRNFSDFISIFQNYNSTPEIFIFTETWFTQADISEINSTY